jgi:hypothetical protein
VGAVEEQLLRVFGAQVGYQCRAALNADARVQAALQVLFNAPADERDAAGPEMVVTLWTAIQDLLNAAANIAKAFWGAGGSRANERADLRAAFQVDDTSPLKNVTMRNRFEHFDEHIDRWWAKSKDRPQYMDLVVGARKTFHKAGFSHDSVFRALDPETGEITFWGEPFSLQAIIDEVQRLLSVNPTLTDLA